MLSLLLRPLLLVLMTAPLCGAREPLSPLVVPLPATGIVLTLGMSKAQLDSALVIWKLDREGEESGRAVYRTDIHTPHSTYTLEAVTKADSLVALSVSALDSGAVEAWFRNLVDRLPMNTTYEQTTDREDMVTETWMTWEAVWITERPLRPEPLNDMTYWEIRLR